MVEDPSSGRRRSQAVQNRSASVISSDSDTTCFTCCCSPCIGLCYLLCLRSMKVSTRLRIVWIWMIALSLSCGLYIRYSLYGDNRVAITSYDMMQVHKVSTFFCQGVTVESGSIRQPLAVYRLNEKPQINYTQTMYNMSHKFAIYFIQERMANFHLLEGSSVSLSICAENSFTIDVIKGHENYEKYRMSKESNKKTLKFKSQCSSKTFDISYTDRYYLILHNTNTRINELQLVLQKTTYKRNIREGKLISTKWQNAVPLDFSSTESIIYQPVMENYDELNITTKCQPLIIIYVGVFFGGSFVLGIFLCYFVKCLCHDPPSAPPPLSTGVPVNGSQDNRLRPGPIPSFHIHPTAPPPPDDLNSMPWSSRAQQFPPCAPPSYDSLFANSANNAPPPYQSTTIELGGK